MSTGASRPPPGSARPPATPPPTPARGTKAAPPPIPPPIPKPPTIPPPLSPAAAQGTPLPGVPGDGDVSSGVPNAPASKIQTAPSAVPPPPQPAKPRSGTTTPPPIASEATPPPVPPARPRRASNVLATQPLPTVKSATPSQLAPALRPTDSQPLPTIKPPDRPVGDTPLPSVRATQPSAVVAQTAPASRSGPQATPQEMPSAHSGPTVPDAAPLAVKPARSGPTQPPPLEQPVPPVHRSMVRIDTEPEPPRVVRSPLVGRANQLAMLEDVVGRAIDFRAPQLVTVVGNQGTGKTRLINELIAKIKDRKCRVFHGAAQRDPNGKPIRHAAFTALLRDRFELVLDADEVARLRLAHEVKHAIGSDQVAEILYFLGGFVGMEFPATPFLRAISENAKQRDELARTALRRFVEGDASHEPLVLVLDDMQWADEDTLTMVNELASGLAGSPVVLLCAARPEMLVHAGGWGEGAVDHVRIDLRNLELEDAEQMFKNLLSRCADVPDDTVQNAVEMTGGNPAFLEQLVRLFLDNGTIDARGVVWKLDPDKAAETELPISIEEAIEARIAALENDERDLLEKAAVFGNVFWVSAVIAMTRLEQPPPVEPPSPLDVEWGNGEDVRRRVSDLIAILADRDYLLPLEADDSSIPGEAEVVFKHNLERELIMRSTEANRLKRYFLSAAQWLEAKTVQRSDEQLEFLANLYEQGGDARRAARCYLQGGDRARARYAPEEARVLYEKGLKMIADKDAPARMDALHNLGDVLEQSGRSDDASACFMEMLQLAWRYDNLAKAGAAYSRLARAQRKLGKYDAAMEHLRRANELFERSRDDRGIASTLDEMGRVNWLRGAFGQALEFHRQALTIRRALGDRRSIALSLANIGRVHHDTGNFKAAMTQFREALDLRRDINDRVGIVQSLSDLAGVHAEDGNHELALQLLDEARAMAQEIGDKSALAEVLSRAGEVKSAAGRGLEAVKDLSDAKQTASGLGELVLLAVTHQRLAQVQLALGNLEAADVEAHAAVAVSQAVGLRVHIGCGYRVKAEVAGALGHTHQAEDDFRRAIDILAAVKHEVELARAYQGLATIKDQTGNPGDAQKLRSRAVEIFTRLRGAASTE
ncbi:MAG TPA: tetratricopeptide repeat protein [Kofleriaceae bacterium]|nr:tetratricopeptide repeat protein [Kofleriaceae bacterium]